MMINETLYIAGFALVVLVVQFALTVALMRALRRVHGLETRVVHLGEALTLLTETAESGFRAVAGEVERLAQRPVRRDGRAATGRMTRAARHGRTVQEIAAAEQVSEGEVRLRLHMADAGQELPHDPAVAVLPPTAVSSRKQGSRSHAHGSVRT
jgi:hypothetical protein